ncbi:hypothetical protein J6590_102181 [Homalodisca vitripennis]|nr:hypothetical protein J6590_102181 [Homalodisca vitripennis]
MILYLSRTPTPLRGYNIIESEGTKSVHWRLTSICSSETDGKQEANVVRITPCPTLDNRTSNLRNICYYSKVNPKRFLRIVQSCARPHGSPSRVLVTYRVS